MPYEKVTHTANGIIEVKKTKTPPKRKAGEPRAPRANPTPEAMRKVNEELSEQRLRHLLYANFKAGDWHCVLTYRREGRPDAGEAKRRLAKFMAALRRLFREVLGLELRYIHVTEYKNAAVHHHLVIEGVDIRPVQKLWRQAGGGMLRATPITGAEHLTNLAYYLVKETRQTVDGRGRHVRRWHSSQNLRKPGPPKRERVPARSWAKVPRVPEGYYLDKSVNNGEGVRVYENPITGAWCQFYRLIPLAMRDAVFDREGRAA